MKNIKAKKTAETRKSKSAQPKLISPFDTAELRKGLSGFHKQPYEHVPVDGKIFNIGKFKWGVYIFYDYDGEPIYVGQTKEKVSGRIGRHLTNQRSDAVAMSVLDPFEVCEIEVFPLPEYEGVTKKHPSFKHAQQHLDALEYLVHQKAIAASKFKAILNEKDPPSPKDGFSIEPPKSLRERIVSDTVFELRGHVDVRIARRSQIISRLAQTISERDVKVGLRRALATQAVRLQHLASERFVEAGGNAAVPVGPEGDDKS